MWVHIAITIFFCYYDYYFIVIEKSWVFIKYTNKCNCLILRACLVHTFTNYFLVCKSENVDPFEIFYVWRTSFNFQSQKTECFFVWVACHFSGLTLFCPFLNRIYFPCFITVVINIYGHAINYIFTHPCLSSLPYTEHESLSPPLHNFDLCLPSFTLQLPCVSLLHSLCANANPSYIFHFSFLELLKQSTHWT